MKLNYIPFSDGFRINDAEILPSFQLPPSFCELSGPATLVRLVSSAGGRRTVEYWFEEEFFERIRNQARLELKQQQGERRQSFSNSFDSLVAMYMRHCFRDNLAVCMDWRNDFGGYRKLSLDSKDKLIALVGPVARQPAYSSKDPQHQAVIANDIWFNGQATQIVIDFSDSRNQPFNGRVSAPIPL